MPPRGDLRHAVPVALQAAFAINFLGPRARANTHAHASRKPRRPGGTGAACTMSLKSLHARSHTHFWHTGTRERDPRDTRESEHKKSEKIGTCGACGRLPCNPRQARRSAASRAPQRAAHRARSTTCERHAAAGQSRPERPGHRGLSCARPARATRAASCSTSAAAARTGWSVCRPNVLLASSSSRRRPAANCRTELSVAGKKGGQKSHGCCRCRLEEGRVRAMWARRTRWRGASRE